MTNRPDSARIDVFSRFLRAHQQISEDLNRSLLEERGMSLPWYDVLLQLSTYCNGRMRLQDLADRVLYSRSGLTRLIDRMEKAGLVSREPCADDRRGTFAVLTAQGRNEFVRAAPTYVSAIEQCFFSKLSGDEIAVIGEAMGKLIEGSRCTRTTVLAEEQ